MRRIPVHAAGSCLCAGYGMGIALIGTDRVKGAYDRMARADLRRRVAIDPARLRG